MYIANPSMTSDSIIFLNFPGYLFDQILHCDFFQSHIYSVMILSILSWLPSYFSSFLPEVFPGYLIGSILSCGFFQSQISWCDIIGNPSMTSGSIFFLDDAFVVFSTWPCFVLFDQQRLPFGFIFRATSTMWWFLPIVLWHVIFWCVFFLLPELFSD